MNGEIAKRPAKPAALKHRASRRMPAASIRPFLLAISAEDPDPQTELLYADPFSLLVAVVLSAQTTDAAVNRATPALFAAAPDPAAMAALGAEGIAPFIRSIGLWQAKSKNVAALATKLVAEHSGAVPTTRNALEALPGVGRKTANVILNVIFGEATMAVDTHVFRLGNRTGLAPGRTERAVEDGLMRRIPADVLRPAHHWLILHGRYVCKARTPECYRCPGSAWCMYAKKTPSPSGRGLG